MGHSGHGSRPENFSDHGHDLPQKCKALAFAWSYHKPNLVNAKNTPPFRAKPGVVFLQARTQIGFGHQSRKSRHQLVQYPKTGQGAGNPDGFVN